MKNVLFINGCPRQQHSRTLKIAQYYIEKMKEFQNITIIERKVMEDPLPLFSNRSFDTETGEQNRGDLSLAYEFANADEIIVAAPFWEFLYPAALSAYFDIISVPSVTFRYTEKGSEGLCKAKTMHYIYTAGNLVPEDDRIGEKLLKKLSTLYGIPQFSAFSVQGLDLDPQKAEALMQDAYEKINQIFYSLK